MDTPVLPRTSARLLVPRLSLASCVRAYVTRSTIGCTWLAPTQRFNHFPATPMCSVSWTIEGEAEMAAPCPGLEMKIPPVFFGGPQTRPTLHYNPGPTRAFMLMLYPAALHQVGKIGMTTWVNRFGPVDEALGPEWGDMARAVLAAPDDAARVALIEAFLEPRWQAARAGAPFGDAFGVLGDWVRRLGLQAAAAGWGHGARYIERRIKAWAGQPMRTLRRMIRAEQEFLTVRAEIFSERVSWSDIAARGGYADQAHLCREVREITGLTPTELARAGRDDESFWIYRIWS